MDDLLFPRHHEQDFHATLKQVLIVKLAVIHWLNCLDYLDFFLVNVELVIIINVLQKEQKRHARVSNLAVLVVVITNVVLSNSRQGTTRTTSSPKCSKFGSFDIIWVLHFSRSAYRRGVR